MIRNDIYTTYKGKEFVIYRTKDSLYKLLSHHSGDVSDYAFMEEYSNAFTKQIEKTDIGEVYRINTYGVYKGHEFPVEGETETTYWLRADQWSDWVAKLEFIRHDRDDITKEVPKSEVDPVYERKTPLPDFFNY